MNVLSRNWNYINNEFRILRRNKVGLLISSQLLRFFFFFLDISHNWRTRERKKIKEVGCTRQQKMKKGKGRRWRRRQRIRSDEERNTILRIRNAKKAASKREVKRDDEETGEKDRCGEARGEPEAEGNRSTNTHAHSHNQILERRQPLHPRRRRQRWNEKNGAGKRGDTTKWWEGGGMKKKGPLSKALQINIHIW